MKTGTCLEMRGGQLNGKDDGEFLIGFEEEAVDIEGAQDVDAFIK